MIQERSILKVVPIRTAQSAVNESRILDFVISALLKSKSGQIIL